MEAINYLTDWINRHNHRGHGYGSKSFLYVTTLMKGESLKKER